MICMEAGGQNRELLNILLDIMSKSGEKTEQLILSSALCPV